VAIQDHCDIEALPHLRDSCGSRFLYLVCGGSIELVREGDPAFAGRKRRDWSKSSAGSRNCEAGSIKPMKVP
jgi:hypothetical protein